MFDERVLNRIADDLQAQANAVRKANVIAHHQIRVPLAAIHQGYPEQALQPLSQWAGQGKSATPYLYQLAVADPGLVPALHAAFAEAKTHGQGNRAYARQQAPSATLYVGSSQKLLERIKQHFGYGYARTYAMQLCHWLPAALDGYLELQAWRFAADTPTSLIQAIEDGLWRQQQPMFGRQGAR
ncbi:GIY-YIG nuclease family protein [Pseudomonas aeruginosa]|uniref:GIY-YIG nuclease family protein n=1 Tax=Pseudomonas aeruginosa TaxID=287 RepID=UPI0028FFD0C2|nr:GIY-YIG nuclease family protein [Pseudomonas aeruginosa]MDU0697894.1 GIY-YIG nuclease family protein [Pseudomonas aeruginosa]